MIPRFLDRWFRKPEPTLEKLASDIDARLAARKAMRAKRSEAALKGHQTRRLAR